MAIFLSPERGPMAMHYQQRSLPSYAEKISAKNARIYRAFNSNNV